MVKGENKRMKGQGRERVKIPQTLNCDSTHREDS
jgi:hypothetical protein